ncbi:MAG: amidohydrolase family protein [bacterium]|nr:amidohydrolase family protein [bacterium]
MQSGAEPHLAPRPLVIDPSVNFRPSTRLGRYGYFGMDDSVGGGSAEFFLEMMEEGGVDMAGIIANRAADGVGGEEMGNHVDRVSPLLESHPDRFFGWVGINPLLGMETIRYIRYGIETLGFTGVHVYPHWFGLDINHRRYYPVYSLCAELGVPIAMQVGSQSMRSRAKLVATPEMVDDVAFDFPELTFVAIHNGWPYERETVMLAKNYENVYILADGHPPRTWPPDIIDYITEAQWWNRDGSRKVMWGTDWPVQRMKESLDEVRGLGLPDDVYSRLVGGNAVQILGLGAG